MKKLNLIVSLLLVCLCWGCTKTEIEDFDKKDKPSVSENEGEYEFDEDDIPNEILTVDEFIWGDFGDSYVCVEGFIVGDCKAHKKNAEWEPPFSYNTAILLADEVGETNIDKVISIQLMNKDMKEIFALCDHPENYGKRARFYGKKQTYLGIPGMKKDIWGYELLD